MESAQKQPSAWEMYRQTADSPQIDRFDLARMGNLEALQKESLTFSNIDQKNSQGHSLLMLAAYNGHLPLTEYLISLGADANSKDNQSNSILMGVAFKGHSKILKLLLAAGADPLYRNFRGQTALQYAAMFGRFEITEILSNFSGQIPNRSIWFFRMAYSWFQYMTQFRKREKNNE